VKEARSLIGRVKDPLRPARLEEAAQQIDVPLTETQAGHFVCARRTDLRVMECSFLTKRLADSPHSFPSLVRASRWRVDALHALQERDYYAIPELET